MYHLSHKLNSIRTSPGPRGSYSVKSPTWATGPATYFPNDYHSSFVMVMMMMVMMMMMTTTTIIVCLYHLWLTIWLLVVMMMMMLFFNTTTKTNLFIIEAIAMRESDDETMRHSDQRASIPHLLWHCLISAPCIAGPRCLPSWLFWHLVHMKSFIFI